MRQYHKLLATTILISSFIACGPPPIRSAEPSVELLEPESIPLPTSEDAAPVLPTTIPPVEAAEERNEEAVDVAPEEVVAASQPLPIRTAFDPTLAHATSEHFVVWWGPEAEEEVILGVPRFLEDLEYAWDIGVEQMGMPGPQGRDQYLINVYLSFTGGEFDEWRPGVGTDEDDFPYMVLLGEMVEDYLYNEPDTDDSFSDFTYHEVFHLFQYAPDERVPDDDFSFWIIESAANWFAVYMNPEDVDTYHIVHAVGLNPQLPLWATDWNQDADPEELSHSRLTQHYGNFHFLEYLEGRYGYELVISPWVKPRPDLLPQEVLFQEVAARGGNFAQDFVDYAALNASWDYDNGEYIEEWLDLGATEDWLSPGDDNRWVEEYGPEGTEGWQGVPDELAPRGYGYNVIRLDVEDGDGVFTFAFEGEPSGSEGTPAQFGVTIIEQIEDERIYTPLALDGNLSGDVSLEVEPDSVIYMMVAATPMRFESNEFYPYAYLIEAE